MNRAGLLWALCVTLLMAGCSSSSTTTSPPSSSATASSTASAAPSIGRFASENPGSVNTFWLTTPQGVVVIDTGRNVSGGRNAAAEIERSGKPVVAILITHPHPDHVGGMGALHQAYPRAPIYASAVAANWMRSDPLMFFPLARKADPDYPAELTYPDHTVEPNAGLDVGGTHLQTAQFGEGESVTTTAYYDPSTRILFDGDLTDNRATPALLEGHTCGWLTDLDQLQARFPNATTMYPGHGAPSPAGEQIEQQRSYLRQFRGLVRSALRPTSAGGSAISAAERTTIEAELKQRYPGYPPVASLPNLQDVNIGAVAKELLAEDSANLPLACRG